MDNSVGAKDGNVAATEIASTVTDSVKSDENASVAVTVVETKSPTIANKSEINCEGVEATKAIADDENHKSNTTFIEDNELNVAMASTSISTTYPGDIKQSQGKDVSKEEHKQSTITEKENGTIGNVNVDLDVSVKTLLELDEEANSSIEEFEDAYDYVHNDEESDYSNVSDQELVSAAESCGEDEAELLDDGEGKELAIPVHSVPVPEDDDFNNPQYVPKQGLFYQHDDRMAYGTDNVYEDDSRKYDEEGSNRHRIRRRQTSSKRSKSTIITDMPENNTISMEDVTMCSKKVLAISKIAAPTKASSKTSTSGLTKKRDFRKSSNIDSLEQWTHDMYNEREQTRKSRDEILILYGYDIREESEAPRARRYNKYGRSSFTTKYNRNWRDTNAYTHTSAEGTKHSSIVKHKGLEQHSIGRLNKNKNKFATSLALESTKPLMSSTSTENSSGAASYFNQKPQLQNDDNKPIEELLGPPPTVLRSFKRYSVQSRRELPDSILNFGDMSKAPQSQQPTPGIQQQQ